MTEPMHRAGTGLLERECELVYSEDCQDTEKLVREALDVDAIVVRIKARITREVIEAARRLKVIGRHGAGVENIDLDAAEERGVVVVNTPEANVESVAEHAVGMMLVLAKRIPQAAAAFRQGDWAVRYRCFGRELHGKTVGIIGFGRIGKRIARFCRNALECEIVYFDIVRQTEAEGSLGARYLPLGEVLSCSDVLSVNVPSTPQTHNLLSFGEFKQMRKGVILLQLSRGGVVNESALLDALRDGTVAGAGIDVFEHEPPGADHPFFKLNNVILTPHMAAHTEEAMERMSLVAEDILRVLKGHPPRYPVSR